MRLYTYSMRNSKPVSYRCSKSMKAVMRLAILVWQNHGPALTHRFVVEFDGVDLYNHRMNEKR